MSNSLTERALLVSVSISEWSARKLDKQETQTLKLKHNLNVDAARVNKDLLPMDDGLERIRKATNAVRALFYERTMPWAQENLRILKAEAYVKFANDIGQLVRERERMVEDFLSTWPSRVAEAQRNLGTLFKSADYPDALRLREKFACRVNFLPVPSADDWRVGISDAHVEKLRQQLREQERAAFRTAMADVWERVHKVVEHAHARLSDPDAIFRDSLVDNALELCALLPSLNIDDDPALEDIRRDLEGSLAGYNVDTLRSDKRVRAAAAQQMQELLDKMGGLYGLAA